MKQNKCNTCKYFTETPKYTMVATGTCANEQVKQFIFEVANILYVGGVGQNSNNTCSLYAPRI